MGMTGRVRSGALKGLFTWIERLDLDLEAEERQRVAVEAMNRTLTEDAEGTRMGMETWT